MNKNQFVISVVGTFVITWVSIYSSLAMASNNWYDKNTETKNNEKIVTWTTINIEISNTWAISNYDKNWIINDNIILPNLNKNQSPKIIIYYSDLNSINNR